MTDNEAVQWFFDLEKISAGFNWPVSVDRMADAKRSIDGCMSRKDSAVNVLAAYEAMAAAIGPTAMTLLLGSDDAFPEVNHSGKPTPPSPGKVTLYVDPTGKRVLAECTTEWGMPPKFSVE